MSRTNVERAISTYYPPRARWYGRLFSPWHGLERLLRLQRIHLPRPLSVLQFIASLAVPGFAFVTRDRRAIGLWVMAGYVLSAVIFVVALGHPAANIGFGLMIGAHATSIIFLVGYWLRNVRFALRSACAVLAVLAVWRVIYAPAVDFAQDRWIVPLRVQGRVVVVRRMALPAGIHRGEWVMFEQPDGHNDLVHNAAVYIQGGMDLGRVLAVAGDTVQFSTNHFTVNGAAQALLPNMPTSGGLVVPEKHWFIWSHFDISGHGNVGESYVTAMLLQMATVSQDQFLGKPMDHWFGRRQVLP